MESFYQSNLKYYAPLKDLKMTLDELVEYASKIEKENKEMESFINPLIEEEDKINALLRHADDILCHNKTLKCQLEIYKNKPRTYAQYLGNSGVHYRETDKARNWRIAIKFGYDKTYKTSTNEEIMKFIEDKI